MWRCLKQEFKDYKYHTSSLFRLIIPQFIHPEFATHIMYDGMLGWFITAAYIFIVILYLIQSQYILYERR